MIFRKLTLTNEEFDGGKVPSDFSVPGVYGVWQKGEDQYFTFSAARYWVEKRRGTLMTEDLLMKKGKEVTSWFGFPGKRNSPDGILSNAGRRGFWFGDSGNCFMNQAYAPSSAAIVSVSENDGCGAVFYTEATENQ